MYLVQLGRGHYNALGYQLLKMRRHTIDPLCEFEAMYDPENKC